MPMRIPHVIAAVAILWCVPAALSAQTREL